MSECLYKWRRSLEDTTVMLSSQRDAMRLVPMLVKRGKQFCVDYQRGGVLITVKETNERGGLIGKWADS